MAAFTDPKILRAVWSDVMDEIQRSVTKHPFYPTDPLRRTAIMMEEAGEAIQAALDLTRTTPDARQSALPDLRIKDRHRLYEETVQTAAMCIKLLASMKMEKQV